MLNDMLKQLGRFCVRHPFITLTLVMAAQCVFMLDARALWFSDEVRYANAFEELLNGHWIVLYLNGEMYPDKPPVFFWFMWLVSLFSGGAAIKTFYITAGLSALLYLFATLGLSSRVLKAEKKVGLFAGLMLLADFYFIGLSHYLRMDLLFSVFILASQLLFYLGIAQGNGGKKVVAAFVLAAFATLTKGPLGLVFPLLTLILFLAWKGNLRRLFAKDMGLGFLLMALICGAWVGGAYLVEGQAYIDNIFYKQIYRRAVDTWHHEQPFWHYFATLPLVWLPWTLVLLFKPVKRFFSIDFWTARFAERKEAGGRAYLWIMFASGLGFLSLLSGKIVVYMLPIFAPLAVLTAEAVLSLKDEQRARFWKYVAAVYLVVAVAAPLFEVFRPWPVTVAGMGLTTICLLGTAAAIYFLRAKGHGPAMAALVLGLTIMLQPLGLLTLPSLDDGMSPKSMALELKKYQEQGYGSAAHKIYAGIFTYYSGHNLLETQDLDLIHKVFDDNEKAAVVFKEKYWNRWENKPEGAKVAYRQWIVDRPYVLVVKD